MSKEYIADQPFTCAHCGEPQEENAALFFHKNLKICGGCYESIKEGDGNERFDQDGFGEPEK